MTEITFIGDVHGKWLEYCRIINEHPNTIQVGDFGVGFRTPWWDPLQMDIYEDHENHRFIRGNHDNPAACKANDKWIPDGHVDENGIFFVGGALSIDQQYRTAGVDWWEDEELSIVELNEMISKYEEIKPDFVVSHDCPESVAIELFPFYNKMQFPSRTRQALQSMLEIHRPKNWWFGHWHVSRKKDINGTLFRCLAELEDETYDV